MGKVEKMNEPIIPATVLFGLIFVSFLPPIVLPKIYPPVSEKITTAISHKKKKI